MRLQWEGDVRFEDIIMSGDYYLTNLDLWLLAIKYNIPLILYSKKNLLENKKDILIANYNPREEYYFIYSPTIKDNIPTQYRLIESPTSKKISVPELPNALQDEIRNKKNRKKLINFIKESEPLGIKDDITSKSLLPRSKKDKDKKKKKISPKSKPKPKKIIQKNISCRTLI